MPEKTDNKQASKEIKDIKNAEAPDVLQGQDCPICREKNLTLTEAERDIPFFGKTYVFSMDCTSCKYHKSDVECAEQKDPVKITFNVENEKDMHVRVIRSSEATIKIPHVITIESGPSSNGYITNIEGVLSRVKKILESSYESEEEPDAKKKAKNLLKKINKVLWGQEQIKIIIEDKSGNSAILSEKAEIGKLR